MAQLTLLQRTQRYWFVDGIPELATGLVFVVIGVLFLGYALGPAIFGFAVLIIPLIGFFLLFGGRTIVHALKGRITYPRTGMVTYRSLSLWQHALGVVLGIEVSLLLFNLSSHVLDVLIRWLPLMLAIALAGIVTYQYTRTRLRRFGSLAVLAILIGSGLQGLSLAGSATFQQTVLSIASFFSFMGLVYCIVGGLVLRRYLRTTSHRDTVDHA